MNINLTGNEVALIAKWAEELDGLYVQSDADAIRNIVKNIIRTSAIEEEDAYLLLELLPRIIPESVCGKEKEQDDSETCNDQSKRSIQQSAYKNKADELKRIIANNIFIQKAMFMSLENQDTQNCMNICSGQCQSRSVTH